MADCSLKYIKQRQYSFRGETGLTGCCAPPTVSIRAFQKAPEKLNLHSGVFMTLIPSWQFKKDYLAGYIAGGGEHGIQIASTADGKPGTRSMCMNLEHYYCRTLDGGRFVPRYQARVHSEQVADGAVRIRVEPYKDWQVEAVIDFKLLSPEICEVIYGFHFLTAFPCFEAFVSNYFHEPTEPYLHLNGAWVQPRLTDREHRHWARGAADVAGMKALYQPSDVVDINIDEACFDYPIMVTPLAGSAQSIVNIIEAQHCSSLSANRLWNAHDFSLLTRDVAAGEKISCRAWFCCSVLPNLDAALSLASKLTGTPVTQ